jgi:CMP-N,N'-diacetyllegionaminic acid synthase
MKYLTVIPARGGSKGIPLKNIYPVHGKPLLEYTIEEALKADIAGDIVVSTDSDKIAEIANRYKTIKVVKRPNDISNDKSSTEDALLHVLQYMKEECDYDYDCVITLQPTSPLRKAETINSFIAEFERNKDNIDAQLTLTESRSDYWIRDNSGNYRRLFTDAPRRRQERDALYIENSAIYVTNINSLIQTHSVLGTKSNGYVISEIEGIDINEYNDIKLVEFYLNSINNNL